jgi:phospholipase A1
MKSKRMSKRIAATQAGLLLLACSSLQAEETTQTTKTTNGLQACIAAEIVNASDEVTIGEIRRRCRSHASNENVVETLAETAIDTARQDTSLVNRHRMLESVAEANPYTIVPYKPNYITMTYNDKVNEEPYDLNENEEVDRVEAKFQLSLKIPLVKELFGTDTSLTAAYTQQSWWQINNSDISAPFRETNYEPEIWVDWWGLEYDLFGFKGRNLRFAINHQSNGRGGDLSRSWNRVYVSTVLEAENLIVVPRVWYRIPEDDKDFPGDPSGDDNPDIEKYLGHGDITAAYKYNQHTFSMILRNNLRSDNKGAVQLDWSFPLTDNLRGYVQYFNGYGESLIDYDAYTQRIGVGVQLTDWLY